MRPRRATRPVLPREDRLRSLAMRNARERRRCDTNRGKSDVVSWCMETLRKEQVGLRPRCGRRPTRHQQDIKTSASNSAGQYVPVITSLPARLASCCRVSNAVELLINFTDPSANSMFAPPVRVAEKGMFAPVLSHVPAPQLLLIPCWLIV